MTVFFYFISFPPGKLRETWIFECYQIWCLVRVSHYQGYKLSSLLYAYMLFLLPFVWRTEKKDEKKMRDADRVFELSKSCANKRHIASMRMFAQTFLPIDAQFKRQNERRSATVLSSSRECECERARWWFVHKKEEKEANIYSSIYLPMMMIIMAAHKTYIYSVHFETWKLRVHFTFLSSLHRFCFVRVRVWLCWHVCDEFTFSFFCMRAFAAFIY